MEQSLKPLTLGELLDRAFFLYRLHFVMFAGIMAVPAIAPLVLQLAGIVISFKTPVVGTPILFFVVTLVTTVVATVVTVVATTLSHGATVVAVSQIQLGHDVNVREAFARIRTRFWKITLISVNGGVRVLLGFLLLIVPGILLALKYALAVPVAVFEQAGISASLSRSGELTKGSRGRIFVVFVLLMLLYLVASMLMQIPVGLVIGLLFGDPRSRETVIWMQVASSLTTFLNQVILGPILPIAITLIYYDVRVKKEAFDLAHMIERLDQSELAATPTA